MADRALRVLAMAWKPVVGIDPYDVNLVESDLIFAGLTGMMDPPRSEALEAIHLSKMGGIRILKSRSDRITANRIRRAQIMCPAPEEAAPTARRHSIS